MYALKGFYEERQIFMHMPGLLVLMRQPAPSTKVF